MPDQLSSLKGNQAIRMGPMAFRPHLAMGLALAYCLCVLKNKKARHEFYTSWRAF